MMTVMSAWAMTTPLFGQSVGGICQIGRIQNAGTFPTPGTVDARRPRDANGATIGIGVMHLGGDDRIIVKLALSGAIPPGIVADKECWGICETNAVNGVNTIEIVEKIDDTTYRLTLTTPIAVGDATVIIYDGDDQNQLVYRSHPGNVNADNRTLPIDLLFLINVQNGVSNAQYGRFSSDIDGDLGLATDDADLQALVRLLDGTDPAGNWINTRIPDACVNEMPDDCDACDVDLDLIPDALDNCPNHFSPNQEDTDTDGDGNVCDNCPTAANADQADGDVDGTGDACETAPPPGGGGGGGGNPPVIPADCPKPAAPGEPDTDGDGVADGCDTHPNDRKLCGDSDGDTCDDCAWGRFDPATDGPDTDGDGMCNASDPVDTSNCPRAAEAGQADTDADGVANFCDDQPADESACGDSDGDTCDDCTSGSFNPNNDGPDANDDGVCDAGNGVQPPDGDGDGAPDDADNCADLANADQADRDDDGFGDVCDNCPTVSNRSQADADNDGVGNACAEDEPDQEIPDTDGDGVNDDEDNCPEIANDQTDGDQDGVGNACDNCPQVSNSTQNDDDGDDIGNLCDEFPSGEDQIDDGSGAGQAVRPCGACGEGAAMAMILILLGSICLRFQSRARRR